jgi:membrane protease subunit (stomatin/prohibitin family)
LLQSSTVGAGSKTNGVSSGQSQTGGSVNSVGSAKQQQSQQQQTQQQQQQQQQSQQQDPKPVECNLCHRKFKNIPALNGHMRLHGGYFKKVRRSSDVYICWVRTVLEPSTPNCE